jgi:hypothetical protein
MPRRANRGHHAVALRHQRPEQVQRLNLLLIVPRRNILGGLPLPALSA